MFHRLFPQFFWVFPMFRLAFLPDSYFWSNAILTQYAIKSLAKDFAKVK